MQLATRPLVQSNEVKIAPKYKKVIRSYPLNAPLPSHHIETLPSFLLALRPDLFCAPFPHLPAQSKPTYARPKLESCRHRVISQDYSVLINDKHPKHPKQHQ
jgi:hypothetical protein